MIDLPREWLALVQRILAEHLPGSDVRAFGSRTTGNAQPWSDLDLVVVGGVPLEPGRLAALRDAFAECDLPIQVDVVQWCCLSPALRSQASSTWEPVAPRGG